MKFHAFTWICILFATLLLVATMGTWDFRSPGTVNDWWYYCTGGDIILFVIVIRIWWLGGRREAGSRILLYLALGLLALTTMSLGWSFYTQTQFDIWAHRGIEY